MGKYCIPSTNAFWSPTDICKLMIQTQSVEILPNVGITWSTKSKSHAKKSRLPNFVMMYRLIWTIARQNASKASENWSGWNGAVLR